MYFSHRYTGLSRIVGRVSTGMMLGLVPAVLYGGLVAAVHLAVTGRWDRSGAFALGCVIVGMLLGLVGGTAWALSTKGGREVTQTQQVQFAPGAQVNVRFPAPRKTMRQTAAVKQG
jgi:hypothetical protein